MVAVVVVVVAVQVAVLVAHVPLVAPESMGDIEVEVEVEAEADSLAVVDGATAPATSIFSVLVTGPLVELLGVDEVVEVVVIEVVDAVVAIVGARAMRRADSGGKDRDDAKGCEGGRLQRQQVSARTACSARLRLSSENLPFAKAEVAVEMDEF